MVGGEGGEILKSPRLFLFLFWGNAKKERRNNDGMIWQRGKDHVFIRTK